MISFTWPLGIDENYTLHVEAEREGYDGVKLSISIDIQDGDLAHIGQLIKSESEQIEQHAIDALAEWEREVRAEGVHRYA